MTLKAELHDEIVACLGGEGDGVGRKLFARRHRMRRRTAERDVHRRFTVECLAHAEFQIRDAPVTALLACAGA